MVVDAALLGRVNFPDGTELVIGSKDWQDFVFKIYGHIDGPPRHELDITSDGEKITVKLVKDEDGS
jgi:hypothetical protein